MCLSALGIVNMFDLATQVEVATTDSTCMVGRLTVLYVVMWGSSLMSESDNTGRVCG